MRRPGLPLLIVLPLAAWLGACGEPVTDPLHRAFDVDPAPVVGEWSAPPRRIPPLAFDAVVEPEAGTLSGYFEFALWGRWWIVRFQDATWDGSEIRFTLPYDFGQQPADSLVYWNATFVPGTPGPDPAPSRLELHASFGPERGCCIVSMSYWRPGAIPEP